MPNPQLLISADSHVIEPPEVWDRVEGAHRDRAPRIEQDEKGAAFFVSEGLPPRRVTHFFGAGTDASQRKDQDGAGFEQEFLSAGWDPAVRLRALDVDGVEAEVLFPSLAQSLFALTDIGLQAACFRAYNSWLHDLCSTDPARLFGVALLPLADVAAAIEEMERAKSLGMVGVLVWSGAPAGTVFPSEEHERFWSAASEMGMPVTMHLGGTASPLGTETYESHRRAVVGHKSIQEVETALVELIFSGVFDRHPALRVVGVETYIGWAPFVMQKLDRTFASTQGQTAYRNQRLPSSYFDDQIGLTFITDRVGIVLVEEIGPKRFMWSSDYPHPNCTWPASRDMVSAELGHLDQDVIERLCWRTAVETFGLPVREQAPSPA